MKCAHSRVLAHEEGLCADQQELQIFILLISLALTRGNGLGQHGPHIPHEYAENIDLPPRVYVWQDTTEPTEMHMQKVETRWRNIVESEHGGAN